VITGTDVNDDVMTEERTPLNANGGEQLVGLKCFKTITSIAFPRTAVGRGRVRGGVRSSRLVLATR
jgi:hypothetical protein